MISAHRLRHLLLYNGKTGVFTWKICSKYHSEKVGSVAGTPVKSKAKTYISIGIDGEYYKAHRLAWLYVYGNSPPMIDHRNGVSTDNRIANLASVTHAQNCQNHGKTINGSGLPVGVRNTPNGRSQARITANRKVFYLGTFDTKDEASSAYCKMRKKIHYCPKATEGKNVD